ncbi:MAG: hypothetical protein GX444_08280 [Myxococcales bacterium]|nr:hypothetical protein [Myxococcales bacterium]
MNRCPWRLIERETILAIKHYRRYREHSLLPRAGGTLDQDARLLQAFDLLDAELSVNQTAEDEH